MSVARRSLVIGVSLAALAVTPAIALAAGEPFYVTLLTRIMIFAIAALSLDLILGYGGLVSFGHAAYLGIGAYAVGILAFHGITSGPLQFAVAILASAAAAAMIGAVSLRTSGVYFIMITLAFAQMLYFLAESLNIYGGDDGLNITQPSNFGRLVDLGDPATLYYVVLAVLLVLLLLTRQLINSRFGLLVQGVKSNERRMAALGFPTFRYKLAAFILSGTICGLAGALFANLTLFCSPAIMHWTRSGEIMMMVILGGMGSLFGPVLGAALYLLLETLLSGATEHWQAILGPILVLVVLFSRSGFFGMLTGERTARGRADG